MFALAGPHGSTTDLNAFDTALKILRGNGTVYRRLPKCSRCSSVRYCGKQCQTLHWQTHRYECNLNTNDTNPIAPEVN